jgi:hypothetical protein
MSWPDSRDPHSLRPGAFRRMARAATAPLRASRVGESYAALRRDLRALGDGTRPVASRVRLGESGGFDLDATAFLHGHRQKTFEDTLAIRQRSTARNAWVFSCSEGCFSLAGSIGLRR